MDLKVIYVNESQWDFIKAALDAYFKGHVQLHSDDVPTEWERKGYLKPMYNAMIGRPFRKLNSAFPTAWQPLCFGQFKDGNAREDVPCFLCPWKDECKAVIVNE